MELFVMCNDGSGQKALMAILSTVMKHFLKTFNSWEAQFLDNQSFKFLSQTLSD